MDIVCQTTKVQISESTTKTIRQVKFNAPPVQATSDVGNDTVISTAAKGQLESIGLSDSWLTSVWSNGFQQVVWAGSNKMVTVVLRGENGGTGRANYFEIAIGQIVGPSGTLATGEKLTSLQTSYVRA